MQLRPKTSNVQYVGWSKFLYKHRATSTFKKTINKCASSNIICDHSAEIDTSRVHSIRTIDTNRYYQDIVYIQRNRFLIAIFNLYAISLIYYSLFHYSFTTRLKLNTIIHYSNGGLYCYAEIGLHTF